MFSLRAPTPLHCTVTVDHCAVTPHLPPCRPRYDRAYWELTGQRSDSRHSHPSGGLSTALPEAAARGLHLPSRRDSGDVADVARSRTRKAPCPPHSLPSVHWAPGRADEQGPCERLGHRRLRTGRPSTRGRQIDQLWSRVSPG